MSASSRLQNDQLVFTASAGNAVHIEYDAADQRLNIDRAVSMPGGLAVSGVTVSAGATIMASSSFTSVRSKTFELQDDASGIITLDAPASVTTHTLVMPSAQGAASTYLKNDGSGGLSWASVAGSGDVAGPSSATDNAVARFDLTTGKLLQNSGVTISDTAGIAGAKTLAMSGATSGVLTVQPAATTTSHTLTMPGSQGAAGSVLQNDGAGALSWAAAGGGVLRGVRRFVSSGTYTPTAGTTRALVYATGAGGAGGGVTTGVNNSASAGGNGGGTYVGFFAINSAQTGTVSIGTGGTGDTGAGNTGGSTSFLFPTTGSPSGQITGSGGYGGATDISSSDEFFSMPNSTDASGAGTPTNEVLLGGFPIGGSRGSFGVTVFADIGISGGGGRSYWAEGGMPVVQNDTSGRTNGNSGVLGSGGSGAIQTNNSQTGNGGSGGNGVVVIYEY
jgi:hypothetical protein